MIRTACPSNWLFQYQSKFLSQKHPLDPEEWVFQFIMHTAMIPKAHSLRFELLWFLQLLGFCGSFLWLVGQDCGRDCSGHGKHLGQGGREGGCRLFFLVYCVNHPFFLLACLSVLMWFWPLTFAPTSTHSACICQTDWTNWVKCSRQTGEVFKSALSKYVIMDHGSWIMIAAFARNPLSRGWWMRFLHATTLHIIWSPLWRAETANHGVGGCNRGLVPEHSAHPWDSHSAIHGMQVPHFFRLPASLLPLLQLLQPHCCCNTTHNLKCSHCTLHESKS